MFSLLKSFAARRISIPVGAGDLVLDVGCGEKPHWRADVLVDRYVRPSHSRQRNTDAAVLPLAPLFEASLERLPFGDRVFDFVYCSHVLEHARDPVAAVAEICRVGKSGYVEVPFVGIQKIYDHETHLWYCDLKDGVLVFRSKQSVDYDRDVARFLRRGPGGPLAFLMNFFPTASTIRIRWSSARPLRAISEGVPGPEVLTAALDEHPTAAQHSAGLRIWPAIRWVLRMLFFRRLRREPVQLHAILRPELRSGADETLRPRIYRVARREEAS